MYEDPGEVVPLQTQIDLSFPTTEANTKDISILTHYWHTTGERFLVFTAVLRPAG